MSNVKQAIDSRRKIFNNVLKSHDGKLMLAMLVEDFQGGPLFDTDPLKMAYNTAQYELVQYMIDMSSGDNDE